MGSRIWEVCGAGSHLHENREAKLGDGSFLIQIKTKEGVVLLRMNIHGFEGANVVSPIGGFGNNCWY